MARTFNETITVKVKRGPDGYYASIDGSQFILTPWTRLADWDTVLNTLATLHPNADIFGGGGSLPPWNQT